jgi:alkaline phosphatase D
MWAILSEISPPPSTNHEAKGNYMSLSKVMLTQGLVLVLVFFSACGTPPKKNADNLRKEAIIAESLLEVRAFPAAPLDPTLSLDRIAFGSCSDQRRPQPIWSVLLQNEPQLYVGLGDNVYASKPEEKPIAKAYAKALKDEAYAKLRRAIPVLGVWDDHDFGQNDGGVDNPEKHEAKEAYLSYFTLNAPHIPPGREGIYHSITLGPEGRRVQFIFLDTRTFRDPLEKNPKPRHRLDIYQPTQDPHKTLLGNDQWLWLSEVLKEPADLRILASSIQLIPNEHSFEKWGNFPHERDRVFKLIENLKIKNLIVVSGDRHHAEISRKKLASGVELVELTASSINFPSTIQEEPNRYRIGRRYNLENFGLARIDWSTRMIQLEIRDMDNKVISSTRARF